MSLLREAVEALLYRYAAVIDDGDLAEWPSFFAEDAEYRLLPRENFVRGLPASLIYCKSRAMMRDRVIAIKKASVYTPHYYRHIYGNVLVERAGIQATLRANYIVCRTQDDGDSIIFSTGRVIAALSVPEELLTAPPPSYMPRSDPPETPGARRGSLDSVPPSIAPRTVRGVGIDPSHDAPGGGVRVRGIGVDPGHEVPGGGVRVRGIGADPSHDAPGRTRPPSESVPPTMSPRSLSFAPPSMAPRSLAYGPPTVAPRSLAYGPPTIAPGSSADPGMMAPMSRRRSHTTPTFLSMTVIYDTCRIPGLLVFPI